ncbi:MAG: thermonuclease family protein [Thermodesulfobacteriota bacterium]
MKYATSLVLLAGCVLLLTACEGKPAAPPAQARVEQVIDGDTVVLAGGVKVRVLGIDAPEMERDGQPADFLAHKAKATLADLTLNRQIGLEYDRSRYDHYGRLLAYLFLPDRTLVNAELVRLGLARVYFVPPNMRHWEVLLAAQQQAIEARRGIWQQLLKQDEPYYLGNRNTLRLHRPTCPLAEQMARANRVRFASLKDAYLQGYSPCRSCKP